MKSDSLEKTLMLVKTEGRRRRGPQRMRWLDGITDWIDMSLSKLREVLRTGKLEFCNPWGRKESDMTWQLNNNNRLILQIIYLGLWKKLERLRGAGYRDKRIFRGGFSYAAHPLSSCRWSRGKASLLYVKQNALQRNTLFSCCWRNMVDWCLIRAWST